MIADAANRSKISLHRSSHDSSGVERNTIIGLFPIMSKTGRAICPRMNEAAIHASTPCSSQASTARATFSNSVFLAAKMTRLTDCSFSRLKSSRTSRVPRSKRSTTFQPETISGSSLASSSFISSPEPATTIRSLLASV